MPWPAALVPSLLLAAAWWRERGARRAAGDALAAAQRVSRLAALDLRGAALRLHGLAGHLAQAPPEGESVATLLAALAERCRLLGDDLGGLGAPRRLTLRRERLDLSACTREAVAALAVALAPGRRRVVLAAPPPEPPPYPADRRALGEILRRVLGEAALHTTEQDCIQVGLAAAPEGGWTITVADEGAGLAAASEAGPAGVDSRGIGAGLALARDLMAAHGGTLDVAARLGTGTRVSLWFPAA